jgi:hypothetical protein
VNEKFKVSALAFIAGAVIESACVCWVHFSERGFALYTALCSMLIATAQVTGLSEALLSKHRRSASVTYVLGFGVGTFFTVYLKTKGWSPW